MSVRQARLALADSRAMEEQAERHNPVNPKSQIGSRKGRTSLVHSGSEYTGSGATPSMGLSQYRGGGMDSGSDSGESLVGRGTGAGTKKGQRRKTARRAYESEAYEMGHHLGKHLHGLHGGGFFDDFAKGFMSVVQPVANIASTAMKVAPLFGLGATGAGATGAGATGAGKKRRGKGKLVITHGGAGTGAGMLGEDGHGTYKGSGFLSDLGIPVISQLAGAIGLGKKGRKKRGKGATGAGNVSGPGYEAVSGLSGMGTGAGEMEGGGFLSDLGIPVISDLAGAIGLGHGEYDGCGATGAGTGAGRSKRAEVVKRVMRERGVSMIEASKIVKAEGLY